ncbi:dipeptide transport binding transmembrane protein [Perkinsela sp. CCAP 1560/4]|nr:dipeptide transport binding transmembrane protein [Perkinsela sp. CCAP 1560/4]|eukprot:KNH09481.1 dipeptide transport binding transmembrane protein [Perkinsela sp. CCAP 1560/4]
MSDHLRKLAKLLPATYRSLLKASRTTDARSFAILEVELGLSPRLGSMALQLCRRRKNCDTTSQTNHELSQYEVDARFSCQSIHFLYEHEVQHAEWGKVVSRNLVNFHRNLVRDGVSLHSSGNETPPIGQIIQSLLWLAKHLNEVTQLNASLLDKNLEARRKARQWPPNIDCGGCNHYPHVARLRDLLPDANGRPQTIENMEEIYCAGSFLHTKRRRISKSYLFPFGSTFCRGATEKSVVYAFPGYYLVPNDTCWRHQVHTKKCEILPLVSFHMEDYSMGAQYFMHRKSNSFDASRQTAKKYSKETGKPPMCAIDGNFSSITENFNSLGQIHPLDGLKIEFDGKKLPQNKVSEPSRFRVSVRCTMVCNLDTSEVKLSEFHPYHSKLVSLSLDEFHLFAYGPKGEFINHILNCEPSGPLQFFSHDSRQSSFEVTFSFPEAAAVTRGLVKLTAILKHDRKSSRHFQLNKQRSGYMLSDASTPLSETKAGKHDEVPLYAFPFYVNIGPVRVD